MSANNIYEKQLNINLYYYYYCYYYYYYQINKQKTRHISTT